MHISYFDRTTINVAKIEKEQKRLSNYRREVGDIIDSRNNTRHEYALTHAISPELHDTIAVLQKKFSKIEHLVLVGIGGSNLGTEAVHSVLDKGKVTLHSLDTVSAVDVEKLILKLKNVRSVYKIAVCVISKSGNSRDFSKCRGSLR